AVLSCRPREGHPATHSASQTRVNALLLSRGPRKRGPIFQRPWLWIPAGVHPRESGGGNDTEMTAAKLRRTAWAENGRNICWCRRADSNRQPIAYEAIALPLSYCGVQKEPSTKLLSKKPPPVEEVPSLRSSPRKRGPRATDRGPWIPAYAGTSGGKCSAARHKRRGVAPRYGLNRARMRLQPSDGGVAGSGAGPAFGGGWTRGAPGGRHRRHRARARRARLIRRRRRHCAARASTTSGERVGLSGLLDRSLRFLLLLARGLIRLPRLPLPACGKRLGVRDRRRRLGCGYGRCRRLGAVLDYGAMVLAGERILPLEGIEPPAHRRDRQPVVGHERVRGPGRIAPRVERARHPFARAALVALGHFELGHQRRHAFPRRGRVRGERLARGGKLLRVERGARDRERGLGVGGTPGRQRLDPPPALARGIARPQFRVGGGEIGMGIGAPRPLDDARGPAPLAHIAEEPPGERRRRHQVGRELGRL